MTNKYYKDVDVALENLPLLAEQLQEDVYLVELKYGNGNRKSEYQVRTREELLALSNSNIVAYKKYTSKHPVLKSFEKILTNYDIDLSNVRKTYVEETMMLIEMKDDSKYTISLTKI